MTDVTVCIPTLPERGALLAEALASVEAQTLQPAEIVVERDEIRQGAGVTRNRAWRRASTTYIAFLDDDDRLYPQHLERLTETAEETSADLVYPWYDDNSGARGAFLCDGTPVEGTPFGKTHVRHIQGVFTCIPITVLVRRDALEAVGGFPTKPEPGREHDRERQYGYHIEEWGLWQRLLRHGARFHHLPERTWYRRRRLPNGRYV